MKEAYGIDFGTNIDSYEVVNNYCQENKFFNVLNNYEYFQNRYDVIEHVYNAFFENFINKSSSNILLDMSRIKLVTFNSNNGNGKSSILFMIPYFIPKLIFNGNIIIGYPEVVTFGNKEFNKRNLVDNMMHNVSKILFGQNYVPILFNDFTVKDFRDNLNVYLSSDKKKEKIQAWNKIKSLYDIKDPLSIEYTEPKYNMIIFRLDEIGRYNNNNTIINKTLDYNFINDMEKLNFDKEEILHFLSLYELRSIISDFSGYNTIDFIVAGKNGFMPFMGKARYNISPYALQSEKLVPIVNKNEYIKKIVLYKLIVYKNLSLCRAILRIKNKFNDDKNGFNKIMQLFYDKLFKYTGGHPRMLSKLLSYLSVNPKNIIYDAYFKDSDSLKQLFENISNDFINANIESIFNRFNDTKIIKRIYGVCNINEYNQNELISFFYYLTKLEEDRLDTSDKQHLLTQCIAQLIKNANAKISCDNVPVFEYLDILDSIGIPYDITKDETKIKMYFPKYYVNYLKLINNPISIRTRNIRYLEFLSAMFGNSPKQNEDVIRGYYFLSLKDKNIDEFETLFGRKDFNYSKVKGFVIKGNRNSDNYDSNIASQINKKITEYYKIHSQPTAFIFGVKNDNNTLHDIFIAIPLSNGGYCLFALQVKNSNSILYNELINGQSYYKIGIAKCFQIAKELNFSSRIYVLVSSSDVSKEVTKIFENYYGYCHIVDYNLVKSIMIENKSAEIITNIPC